MDLDSNTKKPLGPLYIHRGVFTMLGRKGNKIKNVSLTTSQGMIGKNENQFFEVKAYALVPKDPIITTAPDLYEKMISRGIDEVTAKAIVGDYQ